MSHTPNLIPGAHTLTPEERAKGGANAAKSRRERKQVISLARDILDMPLHRDELIDAEDLPSISDIESANVDVKTKIIATLAIKALDGNVKAMQTLFTLTGDYATRQEARITLEEEKYDDEFTEYIAHIGILGESPSYEVKFYDKNHNLAKAIYGDEAERIAEEMLDKWKNGKGQARLQYKIHACRVYDGEKVIVHSLDGGEDYVECMVDDVADSVDNQP